MSFISKKEKLEDISISNRIHVVLQKGWSNVVHEQMFMKTPGHFRGGFQASGMTTSLLLLTGLNYWCKGNSTNSQESWANL